ncbi:DUF4347 domain-containing protein, partial [Methylobacter psychrophilus]|uniref:DUF4347 domain-containing protein n=1 Tax=Methylobacter psychrophilus TaxID=96941 RepID=UPI0021D4F108
MNQVITPVKKLLVIDSQVGNWQSLAADVGTDTAVLILDSGSDGLTQISAYLTTLAANTQNFVPLQSLQIISHGSAGSISLGSTTLTTDNLQQYTSQLATIGNALTATGDILLYGCNVAADPVGLDFINQFSALTSADVAASTDLTGATALGGNWVLEAATGTIEAIALQPVYNGILAGAAVINFNKGEVDNPQVASTPGNIGMTQSAYAGFANVAPQSGGLTAGTNAAGAYYEDGFVVGIVEDTSNNIAHVHRGGTTNDRNVMYHSDSSGLYIRALDSTSFSLTSLNFDALASDENPYATGTYISESTGESVTSVAGDNDYWEILGYASALNPTLDTDANSGAYIARQIVTNGFNGVLTLDSAFHNIGAFWIHYAGYQQTPTDGYQFAMSLDNIQINIAQVNTAPVAVDDNLTATEDTLIIYTAAQLLGNDTDVEGAALTIASVTSGNNGTAVLNADGTVSFTPSANFNGLANFSYVASDGGLLSTRATVTITVAAVNDASTGTVTITGTATQNQTLTAVSTLADVDGLGTIAYQWLANGAVITGATTSTLTLTQAQVGKTITVKAAYTDLQGTAESVSSLATANVANVNDAPTGTVTITGTATQNQTLTATNTLADVDGLGTIAYQWLADGTAISGATTSTLALAQAQVGKTITVTANYSDVLNTSESVTSAATLAVVNVNDTPSGTVTITGTAMKNQVLTATNTLADVDGLGTITYQWLANGITISGATSSTLTLSQAEVGKIITVTASYSDLQKTVENVSSVATSNVSNVNDAPTGTVIITGTATQNQVLTAANTLADVDGLGTIAYQWLADGTAITGATAAMLTLTQAQVGKVITVKAAYTDLQGTAESVSSLATANVANVNDAPTGTVTITGTATQNQILTATNTLADVDGLGTIAYQWLADGMAISGATTSTLALAQAQVGKTITVTANYSDVLNTSESVTSAATLAVVNVNDTPSGTVTITGTAMKNQVLTATNTLADVDGLGTITYQWLANGITISGATSSTLTLSQAEVGKTITVTASYSDLQKTVENVSSVATSNVSNVNDAPTGTVIITGTATQNQVLTAANTLADVDGLGTIAYQWLADGTAITGATAATLTLTQAQVGKVITVKAAYTDLQGTAESVSSLATANVANVNDAPTGTVTITGTATQNQTLTATNTLADIDGLGTIAYQWLANGTAISGATSSTLALAQAQVGKTITVKAAYTDLLGTAENVSSIATGAVINANDAPIGTVTITGTATQNQILTATNTLADVDGLGTIAYQWLANGTAITGATASTLTLSQAQVGKTITVQAGYTDMLGTVESVTSSVTTAVTNVNDLPTGTVTISGTPTQGQTLTVANSLDDIDGLGPIAYQWYAGDIAISGTTATTLTLSQAEVGKIITVKAGYTDVLGTAESVISSVTTAVANINDLPTGMVTISGTASQHHVLTATNTLDDIDGLGTIAYQWLADGSIITGATASTLTLTQEQVGKTITVKAGYTDQQNTAETISSSATKVVNSNYAPTGTVTITGTASQNQTLTATNTLADIDGLGTISYQWLADNVVITNATTNTLTLTQAEVGKAITVTASYTDLQKTPESVTSSATTHVINVNDAPTGTVT